MTPPTLLEGQAMGEKGAGKEALELWFYTALYQVWGYSPWLSGSV